MRTVALAVALPALLLCFGAPADAASAGSHSAPLPLAPVRNGLQTCAATGGTLLRTAYRAEAATPCCTTGGTCGELLSIVTPAVKRPGRT